MAYTNLNQVPDRIAREQEFKGNSLRAERFDTGDWIDMGRLPMEWRDELHRTGARYVVFSYATPIAWVTHDGEVVIPDVKYSVSTSKQQGKVRFGFHVAGHDYRQTVKVDA